MELGSGILRLRIRPIVTSSLSSSSSDSKFSSSASTVSNPGENGVPVKFCRPRALGTAMDTGRGLYAPLKRSVSILSAPALRRFGLGFLEETRLIRPLAGGWIGPPFNGSPLPPFADTFLFASSSCSSRSATC